MAGGASASVMPSEDRASAATDTATNAGGTFYPNFTRIAHSESLLDGLNALRCADKLFDVTLIVEGRTFKAHRVVLAACSDYFCAMFTNDAMCEASASEIKLNGVTSRGIELLLDYAYTARLELDAQNVQDVLSVATHVQLRAVIEACSNFLESQIDLENCVAIAALADLYSLEALKRKTYRFMCSRLAEFAKTPDLRTLKHDQLEHVLACNYPVDCSEARVLEITLQYCVEMRVSAEHASTLFAKVRFNQIDACALNAIIACGDEGEEKEEPKKVEEQDVVSATSYRQVIHAEIFKQQQRQLRAASSSSTLGESECDDVDEIEIMSKVLTNSRGMELALVKIGGFETNGLTNQISCYLPSKGKWENLTVIPHIEQCNYGTAVLGNDVYVVGGSYDVCLKEYIHNFGFRYCPTKNKWKTIAPIQADRCRFSLNAMGNNCLYAVGGVCELNDNYGAELWGHAEYFGAISNCERYHADKDRWEYLPSLAENRSQHAGAVLGQRLYISGGIGGANHTLLATLWCFDTTTEKWEKLRPMPTPRADHVLIAYDCHIYACGGWYEDPVTETRVLTETIDVYDVTNDSWSTESQNPLPKYYTGIAAVKRKIYFIGGLLSTTTINRATSAVQCYDLDTKQWSLNSEWEYPKEVWECTCAAFYVPRERDDLKCLDTGGTSAGGGGGAAVAEDDV